MHNTSETKAADSPDYLRGQIDGLAEACRMANARPTAFAFSVAAEIQARLAELGWPPIPRRGKRADYRKVEP